MEKMNKTSLNLTKLNVDKLKEFFPNVVTEGKIDFDILRTMLGDEVDDSKEKYQFAWNGKSEAIKVAQSPSTATLRPDKESSKEWDTTENLYIEGDNLEVLKQLQKTYYGKIKMIYIDPPYNTGNDFVYHDDFKNSIDNYKEQSNQLNKSNPETNGRYHTDWLNMMYPRLMLAKNLLTDDGIIFISIDDNEINNLLNICNSIFGETNFIANFTWIKTTNPPSLGLKVRNNMEYILCYSKNSKYVQKLYGRESNQKDSPLANVSNTKQTVMIPSKTCNFTNFSNGIISKGCKESSIVLENDIRVIDNWNENDFRITFNSKWSQKNIFDEVASGTHFLVKDSEYFSIRYIKGNIDYVVPDKYLDYNKFDVKDNEYGRKEIESLMGNVGFDYPKNTPLIKTLIKMNLFKDKDGLVLDFFSGSATTAHAVMKLNAEDGGNRKFIMVQLPELCDEKSEAYKAGYKNICEIGKERIRRAGEQIKAEWEKEHPSDTLLSDEEKFTTDIGFKVFKLDSTNIQPWDSEIEISENKLFDYTEVFKPDRSKEDILYEIMLKYGIFDMPAEKIKINGKTMYRVGKRYMIVCLENEITPEDVKAIAELSPRSVVFKESGFENDNDKINAEYNLEKADVEDVKCI